MNEGEARRRREEAIRGSRAARKETIDSGGVAAARDAEARAARMRETERGGRRAALEAAAAERHRILAAANAEEESAVRKAAQLVEGSAATPSWRARAVSARRSPRSASRTPSALPPRRR